MYSSPVLISLRNALRRAGVLRTIQTSPFYRLINQGYESRFDQAMMNSLKPGMRVFDIGANVGYYSKRFADRVGPSGSVHAFEPVPASANAIRETVAARPWIEVHQCAVADQPGELVMAIDANATSPNNKIVLSGAADSGDSLSVPVVTIDQVAKTAGVPDAIKIDVEGYEWHVIRGGAATLANPALRHVFVEVHFGLLEQRGLATAADDIRRELAEAGFVVKFTDFSHLHAFRA
jgi:FkbM family methyltransferase